MQSHSPSGPLMRALFAFALAALGAGLYLASRWNARCRSQLTAARTVQIGSADGVYRHYRCVTRGVRSRAGRVEDADVALCFDNARLGLLTLLSPHAVGRIVHALLDGRAEYQGNAVLVLWFYGLTRHVLPIGRSAALKRPLPDAYTAHDPNSRVAARIVREPPAYTLDPTWHAARHQRAKMVMLRGSAGEPVRLW